MPLGARHQRVAAPDEPDARPVRPPRPGPRPRSCRSLRLQPLHHVLRRSSSSVVARRPRAPRFTVSSGFSVELRDRRAASRCAPRGPARPSCGPWRQRPSAAWRHRVVVGELLLVAPLVGVDVVPARRVLQPRRPESSPRRRRSTTTTRRAPASPGRRSAPGRRRSRRRSRRTSSAWIAARYIRLPWYQWLMPAPMMMVHLPFGQLGGRAPLAREADQQVSRPMPVYFSDQAGV